jgi:hypothetical protein
MDKGDSEEEKDLLVVEEGDEGSGRKVQDPAEESAERVETRLILQQYPAKRGKAGLKPGTKVWTMDRNYGKWDILEGKVLPKAIKGKGGKGVPTPSGTQRVEMKSGSGRGSIWDYLDTMLDHSFASALIRFNKITGAGTKSPKGKPLILRTVPSWMRVPVMTTGSNAPALILAVMTILDHLGNAEVVQNRIFRKLSQKSANDARTNPSRPRGPPR